MNRLFLLIIFIFFFIIAKSEKNINKYSEIDSLLRLSRQEFLNINHIQSIKYANDAFRLSRENDYVNGEIKSCFYISQSLCYLGSYDKALDYMDLLNENFDYYKKDYLIQYEISRIRGQIYNYIGLLSKSNHEFHKGLVLADKIKEKDTRIYCKSLAYENLGIWHKDKNMDSVYYYSQLNQQLLERIDEKVVFRNKMNLYTLLGEYYIHKERYDSTKYFLDNALHIAKKYDFKYISWVYYCYGTMEIKQEKYKEALVSFAKSIENLKLTNQKNELPAVLKQISDVYFQLGIVDSANYYNKKFNIINSELESAKKKSIDKAVHILIQEEKRYSNEKLMHIITVFAISFIFVLVLVLLLYFWWCWKRKNRIELNDNSVIAEFKYINNDSLYELVALLESNSPIFISRFKEVYPEFTYNLQNTHTDLTQAEFELCALMYLNFTSKEIARFQYVQHRSVQTRKSRLRKKLNLKPADDLYLYMRKFV